MTAVAIIPARGGSKRIPRKNIRNFLGKPIIAYAIDAALKSGLFSEVMVSTEDEEIASVAKDLGATVPFMRSRHVADDFATTADVLLEVLQSYEKLGRKFAYSCCIYPTAPFITEENLERGFAKLVSENRNCVFPVVTYEYPIWRAQHFSETGRIEMIWPEHLNKRSQDLIPAYHDAGQWYWFKTDTFILERKLFGSNTSAIVLDQLVVQDIDNISDWQIAELKYQLFLQNKSK